MPRSKPFNLILLGDPASGKGTQAARLVKKYRFYDLDMGHEIRKPAARRLFDYARTSGKGKLTPTHVVRDIFKKTIGAVPVGRGILFNGTPKMFGEAKLVARLLKENGRTDPLVIYLGIPENEMLKRAEGRSRDDDTRRALRNRRKYYKEQVARVVQFFGERYEVKKISGMGSRDEVWKKIDAVVRRFAA